MPQVPAGWKETTLGEVLILNYGKGLTVEKRINGTIPVYWSSWITGYHNQELVWWPWIIIWRKWSVGKVYFSKQSFYPIDTVYYILPDKNYDLIFIYNLLLTLGLDKMNSDSAVPWLNRDNAYALLIHLPPLPEQQAIAAVLSSFDDKIELLRAENQTLEQMGQELFKERFGKWKVGDELPEGWRVGKLGEKNFAEIIGSWIERFDREKIYLATADVINSSISNSNTKITYQDRPSRANMQPTEKSIWFAKMQDSRKLLMFDDYSQDEIENYILSTWFAGIKTSELSHYYLWCFVLSDDFDMIKNNMANGAVQIAVNNSNLEKIEILIPNEEFLRKFNEFVKPLFKKIYLNNKQITSLSATRDQLLPKLMSGEVRVEF